jgi:hypothetical protein
MFPNHCVLQHQHVDCKIGDTLLKIGVTFNDVTKDAAVYTTTSRFVVCLGGFPQERQKLHRDRWTRVSRRGYPQTYPLPIDLPFPHQVLSLGNSTENPCIHHICFHVTIFSQFCPCLLSVERIFYRLSTRSSDRSLETLIFVFERNTFYFLGKRYYRCLLVYQVFFFLNPMC